MLPSERSHVPLTVRAIACDSPGRNNDSNHPRFAARVSGFSPPA